MAETSPRLCFWQCPSATKFLQPLTVDSWLGGSTETALHSETTRLQVMPCAVPLSPQLPELTRNPSLGFLTQYQTKIPTLLMTRNKILQRRVYLEQWTWTRTFSCTGRAGHQCPLGAKILPAVQQKSSLNYSKTKEYHKSQSFCSKSNTYAYKLSSLM